MIESVEFIGLDVNPYTVKLVKPDPGGFTIRDISGVGAGKADLHLSGRASMDGEVFNGARRPSRNIVFQFGYGTSLDPEDGRDISYDVFPLKQRVEMVFRTTKKNVRISGTIESNEPSIFTKEPAFDVSIVCEEPYFRSLEGDRAYERLYSLESLFEFEFSNESLDEDLIEFGEYNASRFRELRYLGNVESGFLIRFLFNGSVTHPSVTSERTNQTIRIDTDLFETFIGGPILPNDIIEVNTIRGSRSATLYRGSQTINVLSTLSNASKWIELRKGLNPMSVNADTNISLLQVEMLHDHLYSGL